MKRFLSIAVLLFSLGAARAVLAEQPNSALLMVTGAYYDASGEDVLITARPARVEVPPGAPEDSYILIEDGEQTYALAKEAYVAVPQGIPVYDVRLQQAQAADFPMYLHEFKHRLDTTAFAQEPPNKGDGIPYTAYSLLYRAAIREGIIASLTYYELPAQ
ncbi:MAG: hypothetical protein GX653_00155 [Clostridiales bacterium]|nr:hypothetical protein [Clostridiales bacterium]